MLTLRSVNYGSTFCAVGARGFAGEGYPFHKLWRFAGMTWEGTTFAGKTMTLNKTEGNMPLKADGVTPRELFPKCIWGSLRRGGEMVNQVGLSNFGLEFYLESGRFYSLNKPFMISIMLQSQTFEEREVELLKILEILARFLPFGAPFALQINFACPNTGHDITTFYNQVVWFVKLAKDHLAAWNVPVVANVNALMPTDVLIEISKEADALWIGNAIPFGERGVDWTRFDVDSGGKPISPLARWNSAWKGGLSSPECLILTEAKLIDLRHAGVKIPTVAGNGIRTKEHVLRLKKAGADAVFYGSGNTVRPWFSRGVIKFSNEVFST